MQNLVPVDQDKENKDIPNHLPDLGSDTDIRSVLSPVKPVNLLPQIPINSNSYRKLSEHEEHDCEIIG